MIKFFKKRDKIIKISNKQSFMNPYVSWIMLVKIFLFLVVVLIVFSLYILYLIKNDDGFKITSDISNNPPSLIEEDLLNKVNESIKRKELNNKNIESGDIRFLDPS